MAGSRVSSSCDRWKTVVTTDSLDGTEGIVDHYSRDVAVNPGEEAEAVFRRLEGRLMRYQIFPSRFMRAEVCSEDGRIHEGTTIVQHVAIGPLPLEAAVRVVRLWRDQDGDAEEIGFTYATLEGHPERGISTFRIRRSESRGITFLIDARSGPGSLLTRLTRPLARRFQRQATEAALAHFTAADP
jgi:uncharacterized protein (UPF0548 family)